MLLSSHSTLLLRRHCSIGGRAEAGDFSHSEKTSLQHVYSSQERQWSHLNKHVKIRPLHSQMSTKERQLYGKSGPEGCFMVPIALQFRCFLHFKLKEKTYQFQFNYLHLACAQHQEYLQRYSSQPWRY